MYWLTRKNGAEKLYIFKGKIEYFDKLKKLSLVAKVDEYLKNGGYPMGMTGENLVILHFVIIGVIILQLIGGQIRNISISVVLILIIDALIILYSEKYKKEIVVQLCDIQDIVYFQSKIKTPQDVVLAYAVRQCQEPLKTPLNTLLSRYNYMGGLKDKTEIFEEFRKTSSVMELQSFSFILEQKERNGFSEDNHKAQATMLKRAKRLRRKMVRSVKRLKLVIASVMLFACYAGFIAIPVIKELMNKLNILWRS